MAEKWVNLKLWINISDIYNLYIIYLFNRIWYKKLVNKLNDHLYIWTFFIFIEYFFILKKYSSINLNNNIYLTYIFYKKKIWINNKKAYNCLVNNYYK